MCLCFSDNGGCYHEQPLPLSATLMDEQVLAAMARWPNVPAVYGWLSLPESGQWRLHPEGDALKRHASRGEEITSPQILAFMNRNYDCDALGQWFFQNGPQRVYVRLDAAPYIAHTTTDTSSGALKLRTHTGLDVTGISALFLDPAGRLYAATRLGGVLVAGRDLPALLDLFTPINPDDTFTDIHDALTRALEAGHAVQLQGSGIQGLSPDPVTLQPCSEAQIESVLGFRRLPRPPAETGPTT